MSNDELLTLLETALAARLIPGMVVPTVEHYLPQLRTGTISPTDLAGLQFIADSIDRAAVAAYQSGGVSAPNAWVGDNAVFAGGDYIGQDQVLGDKIVYMLHGDQPPPDMRALLRGYLDQVQNLHSDLYLARIGSRAQSGSGADLMPQLKLADVYTNLVVDGSVVVGRPRERTQRHIARLAQRLDTRQPDQVPSADVRFLGGVQDCNAVVHSLAFLRDDSDHPDQSTPLQTVTLLRSRLALEALAAGRVVLLGDPGSGKSTVLRYLALLLAQAQQAILGFQGPVAVLPAGWRGRVPPTPVLCSLALVADELVKLSSPTLNDDTAVLWQALERQVNGLFGQNQGLSNSFKDALKRGGVVVLLDGLDEVSAAPDASGVSLRARLQQAIVAFGRALPRTTPLVVTSRILPYVQPPDAVFPRNTWHFSPDDGWQVATLQPLAFGQVRQFCRAWYQAASASEQPIYAADAAAGRAEALLRELDRARLRVLTTTPLLLTMLAILHYNRPDGTLPTSEAGIYEECVKLLVERWEPVRTLDHQKPGLLELLTQDLPHDDKTLEDIRAILHTVAFQAHERPPEPGDGRGMLRQAELTGELIAAFKKWRWPDREQRAETCLTFLRLHAGLLHELDDDRYAFPHLTFQEYLAACWLADGADPVQQAYVRWSGPDGDRWRTVLLLLAGRLRAQGKVDQIGWNWLRCLVRASIDQDTPKSARAYQRDAVLAWETYQLWGGRTGFRAYDDDELMRLEQKLTQGLMSVLQPAPLASQTERLAAGFALGALGDPRPGVCTLEPEWCAVPGGVYTLGSAEDDAEADDDEKPGYTVELAAFSISRYPVTNAQWQRFMDAGGYTNQAWWLVGWEACEGEGWTAPEEWENPRFNGPNQPVVGVSWYEARAYCTWLAAELGYAVRLPTEAEWEATARGTDRRAYPWGDEWNAACANTIEARFGRTTAVGSYPEGVSPWDVLDMSGNVFEWTDSAYAAEDRNAGIIDINTETYVSVRGGAWDSHHLYARCAYCYWSAPAVRGLNLGVRVARSSLCKIDK